MVIKVLFVVLILCTAALIGVGLAIHFRVKRHLRQEKLDAQRHAGSESASSDASNEPQL